MMTTNPANTVNIVKVSLNHVEKKIILSIPYHSEIISFMKIERGYAYNPLNHTRSLAFNKTGLVKLIKLFRFLHEGGRQEKFKLRTEIDPLIQKMLDNLHTLQANKQAEKAADQEQQVARITQAIAEEGRLSIKLFPYQREGLDFITRSGGNCIIGDEMGLGKTAQAVAWTFLLGKKTLILCPKSLIYNWTSEIAKITGLTSESLAVGVWQNEKKKKVSGRQYTVINYDQLDRHHAAIAKTTPYEAIILDEAHYIKNGQAKRTKAALKLAKKAQHRILLSGTSIKNRPIEFWTQLNLLAPTLFDNWLLYAKRYCGAYRTRFGWDVGRATHLPELHEKITHLYLRREKKDVFKDMPEKLRSDIKTDIAIPWVRFPTPLEMISDAKMRAALAKVPATLELLRTILDIDEECKIVVFSDYVAPGEMIANAFASLSVRLLAADSPAERQEKVETFKHDKEKRIFISTIKLAGVGLNLTAASRMIFNDLPWSPADLLQAEDRIYRIGQNLTCNIYRILSDSEIDQAIVAQLRYKGRTMDMVLKGEVGTATVGAKREQTPFEDLLQRLVFSGAGASN